MPSIRPAAREAARLLLGTSSSRRLRAFWKSSCKGRVFFRVKSCGRRHASPLCRRGRPHTTQAPSLTKKPRRGRFFPAKGRRGPFTHRYSRWMWWHQKSSSQAPSTRPSSTSSSHAALSARTIGSAPCAPWRAACSCSAASVSHPRHALLRRTRPSEGPPPAGPPARPGPRRPPEPERLGRRSRPERSSLSRLSRRGHRCPSY